MVTKRPLYLVIVSRLCFCSLWQNGLFTLFLGHDKALGHSKSGGKTKARVRFGFEFSAKLYMT